MSLHQMGPQFHCPLTDEVNGYGSGIISKVWASSVDPDQIAPEILL